MALLPKHLLRVKRCDMSKEAIINDDAIANAWGTLREPVSTQQRRCHGCNNQQQQTKK
jgi:hypothetical protein